MTTDVGFWQGILETAEGRGQLRFIVQPIMAIILGVRLGITDAKTGEDPFLLRLFVKGKHRAELAKHAFTDALLPFGLAVVIDSILQYFALGYVRPGAAVVVGALIVWLPFSLARSFTNRIYTRRHGHRAMPQPSA